jgi:dolichol kinase
MIEKIWIQLASMGIFLMCYLVLFRYNKECRFNRFYLLTSLVISIVIPYVKFEVFPYEVVLTEGLKLNKLPSEIIAPRESNNAEFVNYLMYFYISVSAVFFMILIRKLYNICT